MSIRVWLRSVATVVAIALGVAVLPGVAEAQEAPTGPFAVTQCDDVTGAVSFRIEDALGVAYFTPWGTTAQEQRPEPVWYDVPTNFVETNVTLVAEQAGFADIVFFAGCEDTPPPPVSPAPPTLTSFDCVVENGQVLGNTRYVFGSEPDATVFVDLGTRAIAADTWDSFQSVTVYAERDGLQSERVTFFPLVCDPVVPAPTYTEDDQECRRGWRTITRFDVPEGLTLQVRRWFSNSWRNDRDGVIRSIVPRDVRYIDADGNISEVTRLDTAC